MSCNVNGLWDYVPLHYRKKSIAYMISPYWYQRLHPPTDRLLFHMCLVVGNMVKNRVSWFLEHAAHVHISIRMWTLYEHVPFWRLIQEAMDLLWNENTRVLGRNNLFSWHYLFRHAKSAVWGSLKRTFQSRSIADNYISNTFGVRCEPHG